MKNFIFICVACLLSSCLGKPEFSNTPLITFKSVQILAPQGQKYGDSLLLTVEFEDGDGDLGTFDTAFTAKNFNILIFKKVQNSFSAVKFIDPTFPLNSTFPTLNSVSNSPIKGELRQSIQFAYLVGGTTPSLNKGDIVKFQIQIIDRAKNKSNIVESNEVVLGKY